MVPFVRIGAGVGNHPGLPGPRSPLGVKPRRASDRERWWSVPKVPTLAISGVESTCGAGLHPSTFLISQSFDFLKLDTCFLHGEMLSWSF